MGRNSGGGYTNPIPPFVPGTTIKTTEMNPKFQDIYDALSDSLSRSGQGAMQVPLRLTDGSAAEPSLTFSADPGTGLVRPAPYTVQMVSQAAPLQEWSLLYVNINRPLAVTTPVQNTTALTAVGNGTGSGGVFTGGTPTGNNGGGTGLVATGGAAAGTGAGGTGVVATGGAGNGVGLRATGTGVAPAAELNGGLRVIFSPLGGLNASDPQYGILADVVMTPSGDYTPSSVLRALVPTQTFKNQLNARVRSKVANATTFSDISVGFSGDVTGTVGLLGQFWLDADAPMVYRSRASEAATNNSNAALALMNGGLRLDGIPPGPSVGARNILTAANATKAWAVIGVLGTPVGSGTPPNIVISDGDLYDNFNVSNVSGAANGTITVTFATPFASRAYKVTITVEIFDTANFLQLTPKLIARSNAAFIFRCTSTSAGGASSNYLFNDTGQRIGFHIDCQGRQ